MIVKESCWSHSPGRFDQFWGAWCLNKDGRVFLNLSYHGKASKGCAMTKPSMKMGSNPVPQAARLLQAPATCQCLMGLNLRNIMPPCLKNSKNERLGLKIEYCSRCSPFHSLVNHQSVSMITRFCSALSGNRRLTWLAQGYVLAMLEDVQWIYLREKLGLQPLCINRWWSFYRSILFIFNSSHRPKWDVDVFLGARPLESSVWIVKTTCTTHQRRFRKSKKKCI